jgi:hypothetical protein
MDEKTPVEVLLERAQTYTRTSIQLFKLKATAKLAEVVSDITANLVILVIIILFFVNLNIGLALLLGALFGKYWLGFVLVSGGYAIIGFVVYLFRESWIKQPVSNSIITQLLKDETENIESPGTEEIN